MFFSDLPPELLHLILSYLKGKDLSTISATCRLLRDIANTDLLWQRRCQNEYHLSSVEKWNGSFKEVFGNVLHKYGSLLGIWRLTTNCYGGLVHIWYNEAGEIVANEYYACKDVRKDLRKNKLFNITMDDECLVKSCFLCPWMRGADSDQGQNMTSKSPRPCVIEHSVATDGRRTISVKGETDKTYADEAEKALFLLDCGVRGTHPELCMYKWQLYKTNTLTLVELSVPQPYLPGKVPIQPGLFKGLYGGHGTEIVLLTYDMDNNKANTVKISGDPNVPAGEVSMCADLSRPMVLNKDQQESMATLCRVESAVAQQNQELQEAGSQPFRVPVDCGIENSFDVPTRCIARYHSLGTVSPMGYSNPSKIANHFIIFNEDTFGVLWLDLYTFSYFSRVTETFDNLDT